MVVDRGGVQYPIEVENRFSVALQAFQTEVERSRLVWRRFTEELAALKGGSAQTRKELKDLAAATKRGATTDRESSRQQETVAQAATARNKKEQREQQIRHRQNRMADEQGLELERRKTQLVRGRTDAEAKLEAIEKRRAVNAAAAREADARGLNAGALKLRQLTVEEEARKRILALQRKQEVSDLVTSRGFGLRRGEAQGPPVPPGIIPPAAAAGGDRPRREAQALNAELAKTEDQGNRIAFTFRRLIGIFATFAIVRRTISGFFGLISDSIKFNTQIEVAQRGIAGLVLAVTDIRDAFGGTLSTSEKFATAQRISAEQIRILRSEAQKTAATFEELLFAFQTAVGPGFAAGLKIDEIRKFAISISQAATALGLGQNQLAEEIRSILQGTITLRNTRIATALNITNQDIRQAKEAGQLVEFLQRRFEAFGFATKASMNDFDIVLGNVKDTIQQLIAQGSVGFFETLRKSLMGIRDVLQTTDSEGIITANPEVVKVVTALTGGLERAITKAREFAETFTLEEVRDNALAVGDFLGSAFDAVLGLIISITRGLLDAFKIINRVVVAVKSIGTAFRDAFPNIDLGSLLSDLIRLSTLVISLKVAFGFVASAVKFMGAGLKALAPILLPLLAPLRAVATTIASSIAILAQRFFGITLPLRAIIIAMTLFAGLAAALTKSFSGVNITLGGILGFITSSLMPAITLLVTSIKTGIEFVVLQISNFFDSLLTGFNIAYLRAKAFALRVAGIFSSTQAEGAKQADAEADEALKQLDGRLKKRKDDFANSLTEARAKSDLAFQSLANNFTAAFTAAGASFAESVTGALGETTARFVAKGPVQTKDAITGKELEKNISKARTLSEIFVSIPKLILSANDHLRDQAKTIDDLREGLRAAQNEFDFARMTAGMSDELRQFVEIAHEGAFKGSEDTFKITQEINARKTKQVELDERLQLAASRSAEFSKEDLSARTQIITLLRNQARISQTLQATTAQIALTRSDIQESMQKGESRQEREDLTAGLRLLILRKEELEVQLVTAGKINTEIEMGALASAAAQGKNVAHVKALLESIKETILLEQASLANTLELADLEEARSEQLRIQNAQITLKMQALRAELSIKQQLATQDQLTSNLEEAALARARQSQRPTVVAHVQAQTDVNRARRAAVERQATFEVTKISLETQRQLSTSLEQQEILKEQLVNLEIRHQSELVQTTAQLQEMEQILERTRLENEGSFGQGFFQGFEDFANQMPTQFQAGVDIAKGIVQEFAAFAAQLIVEAFDPTSDASLRERLAKFFQGIAQSLLTVMIQLAIASLFRTTASKKDEEAALKLVGAAATLTTAAFAWNQTAAAIQAAAWVLLAANAAGGASGTSGFGKQMAAHGGGKVTARGMAMGAFEGGGVSELFRNHFYHHTRAQGLAAGGFPQRPSNLHPEDKIPIWVALKEWIIRSKAVRLYGDRFFQMANSMQLDPEQVQLLVSSREITKAPKRARGFIEGGSTGGLGSGGGTRIMQRPGRPDDVAATIAMMAPSERYLERTLAGGRPAFLRFLQESAAAQAALGQPKGYRR